MSNFIISLKHTENKDPVITFWRPNAGGYTVAVDQAGKYTDLKHGYHLSDNTLPRPDYMILPLLEKMSYGDYRDRLMLPNTKRVWEKLGCPEIAKQFNSKKARSGLN